jgi:hypothetical protein
MAIPMPGSYVLRQNQGLLGHLLDLSWAPQAQEGPFLDVALVCQEFPGAMEPYPEMALRWRLTLGRRRRAYLW